MVVEKVIMVVVVEIGFVYTLQNSNTGENYKVHDLNVEADAQAEEDEEDDVDWEEGQSVTPHLPSRENKVLKTWPSLSWCPMR
ncbi:uncharacterized protein G2W53_007094 [Senna tora]|uniref:Uncharacterized protein n=1 Tax=Senna tora TaxID=362788 RepID=A0A834X5F3_9FABA|nr:uncharacterized protein G2W53_007094 [Senna tora]